MNRYDQAARDGHDLRREQDQAKRERRRLQLDDVIIDNDRKILLRSANGHYWSIQVSNAGVLSTTDEGTSL